MSSDITREQWVEETERLCPSSLAFNAYEALERLVVEETDLAVTYKRLARGQSKFAAFTATAENKCNVIQILKGQCQLNWRPGTKVTSMGEDQAEAINQAFEDFRTALNGTEGKAWETVKVLRLGVSNVKGELTKLAESLLSTMQASNV